MADVYPADGQPAQAVVTVMPVMDDLSDEQAAAAGRARSAWPAGLSLELSAAAVALNVVRAIHWLKAGPLATTRASPWAVWAA